MLIDSGTSLPFFGGYSTTPTTDGTTWTMYSGEVAIQSFDVEGEISGMIVGQLWRGPGNYGAKVNSVFWIDVQDSLGTGPASSE